MIKYQVSQEEMVEYGDFFRFMRKSIMYSLKEMAEAMNVPTSSLSKWERGQVPAVHNVQDLEMKVRKIVKGVIAERKMKAVS